MTIKTRLDKIEKTVVDNEMIICIVRTIIVDEKEVPLFTERKIYYENGKHIKTEFFNEDNELVETQLTRV